MKKSVFLLTTFLIFISCNAQEKKRSSSSEEPNMGKVKPHENWTVNKDVDENGNVIRLDSTYTWSFSSDGNEISQKTLDSLMNSFKLKFKTDFPSMFDDDFLSPFPSDSVLDRTFFDDGFFMKDWEVRKKEMEQMMRKADSIHQGFLDRFRTKNRI